MYGFIYITTNNINGKKYIGQKAYHMPNWKNYLGSGTHLTRAIKKYGRENFSREIIDEANSKKELDEKEIYWIKYYNAVSSDEYYNIASGGDGGWVNAGKSQEEIDEIYRNRSLNHQVPCGENTGTNKLKENDVYDIINRFYNNETDTDIALIYNVSYGTINDIRLHRTWKHITKDMVFPKSNGIQRSGDKRSKMVDVYTTNGEYIDTYKSARDIQDKLGVSFKYVSRVCRGERKHSKNYVFRFNGEPFDKYSA